MGEFFRRTDAADLVAVVQLLSDGGQHLLDNAAVAAWCAIVSVDMVPSRSGVHATYEIVPHVCDNGTQRGRHKERKLAALCGFVLTSAWSAPQAVRALGPVRTDIDVLGVLPHRRNPLLEQVERDARRELVDRPHRVDHTPERLHLLTSTRRANDESQQRRVMCIGRNVPSGRPQSCGFAAGTATWRCPAATCTTFPSRKTPCNPAPRTRRHDHERARKRRRCWRDNATYQV